MKRNMRGQNIREVNGMNKKRKAPNADDRPVIPPAGQRADRRGPHGIPIPDRESVREEFEWREEHQQ